MVNFLDITWPWYPLIFYHKLMVIHIALDKYIPFILFAGILTMAEDSGGFIHDWGRENDISEQTVDVLIEQDVSDRRTLMSLTSEDIEELGLEEEEKTKLNVAITHLNTK